jgi:protocatechuate 3,4-dioxygenase beta subunit
MTRRALLAAFGALYALTATPARAQAVDPEFLRMWNAGLRRRPARLASAGRLTPDDEPGAPLTVRARLFAKDGRTPVAGALVQAYQTDITGRYLRDGDDTWRLQGWVRTDTDGRFQLATVHPGAYPSRSAAAHIHFHAEGAGLRRQSLATIYFEGDPLLTAADRAASRRLAPFGTIWPVERRDGREECDILFRVTEGFVF